MIIFFEGQEKQIFALQSNTPLSDSTISKLVWLFDQASPVNKEILTGYFIGPRREMVTPWSTNAVEITQNMGISGIIRIEEFFPASKSAKYDPMLQRLYENLDQQIFTINRKPESILYIDDIAAYNSKEGLALSSEEINYLNGLSQKIGRKLTDSEIFGFSQVNSEHCRHKIFNGTFIIDGEEKPSTLFQLIKKTSKENPNTIISAYRDNCAFLEGPEVGIFAPETQDKPDFFQIKQAKTVLSLKAETHNFPTTVEPFNGAATGTGGEIRDRIAGGKGAFPIAGTAVYMTSYPRLEGARLWERKIAQRKWLYQTPEEILIKASNGASDFGNKFGQPLICGSVLTFEYANNKNYGYDKVIMQAGGIGFGKFTDSNKDVPEHGDKIVLLGGDNYRIGMGGGAVSSVATGEFTNAIELNAVQRSNPEMQKRVSNAIRALCESDINPVVSIHDHGAGGHLNCLSELVDATGGVVYVDKLPVGDPTLSAKEIVGNESQERMGLVLKDTDIPVLERIAERERAPMYVVGEVTGDKQFTFNDRNNNTKPIDLQLEDMFGNPPKTIMRDQSIDTIYPPLQYDASKIAEYLEQVLQLESVACKDWLTNKVDRSVTGRIALQQTTGSVQLPLNNLAVIALDYAGPAGMATSLGHAPVAGLIDAASGSRLAIAEALTNIVWAPLKNEIKGISLSANWMWPCRNEGEDARLYEAVEAASIFAIDLGINIPTGKDSLSMTQKYPDGEVVLSPGTVIISAASEVIDIKKCVTPVIKKTKEKSSLYYVDFSKSGFKLGGSAFAQILNEIGDIAPDIFDSAYFVKAFNTIQHLIRDAKIVAGHDISSGGLITTLLEMNFANNWSGMNIDLTIFHQKDPIKILFSEKSAIILQIDKISEVEQILRSNNIEFCKIGEITDQRLLNIKTAQSSFAFNIDDCRDTWYKTSYLLDKNQSGEKLALERFRNYKKQELHFNFPVDFASKFAKLGINPLRTERTGIKTAIIREKGVNGDREMAYAMHLAGMDVKDVHMTDLISGRETLEDINMIVFVGGFSNSDVLGSAKGWAGAFLYNPKAKLALENFYKREDTLSLGVCNGCQVMVELELLTPGHDQKQKMRHNSSHKFESIFLNVSIPENKSVMLNTLAGSRLGIWVAHGEGRFELPYEEDKYNVAMKYSYEAYPGNPNGSDYNIAGICSSDGRHLVMMPHLERSLFTWNWANYPEDRISDEVSPWIEAFINARKWIQQKKDI